MKIDGLYHELHGPDDAPSLILSAGLGGAGSYWQPNLEALSRDFRVVVYDHRGTAHSDRAMPDALSVGDMAADLLALMDGLGLETAHVVGHAAGGLIGMEAALAFPGRIGKLVIVNGWARPDPHFARCFEARLALLRAGGPRAYLRAQPIFLFPAQWISDHDAELDEELEHQLANFQGVGTLEKRIAALRAFDVTDRLGDLDVPVLALASEDDMLVPAGCTSAYAAKIPGARTALMPWGGHACNVTDPRLFEKLVIDFLRS